MKLAQFFIGAFLSHAAWIRHALFGLGLASFSVLAQAPLDVRVALIIGNAAYRHVPTLANSANDAKSMSVIMKKLGFQVFDVIDGDKAAISKAIAQMRLHLNGQQAVAMLYYAGHGLQLDWRNYMVPVDAKLNSTQDVIQQTIDIETVIQTFKSSQTRMNVIVLDACRDNPFATSASGKGLAQLDAPPGTYLAFATSPGNVAEDGDSESGNGLFTQFLIKELQKPAKIEDVFKRVRLQVRQKSQGRQIPWDSSSLEDDFAFNDGNKHTFNPEDYIREAQEAKANEARLKAQAEAAKQGELQLIKQREQDKARLAQEQQRREQETEALKQRAGEIAKLMDLERQKFAESQKIKELQARQKALAETLERERQLARAAQEQKIKEQALEQAQKKAEAEAKEQERQWTLATEAEKKKAQDAAQALEKASLAEARRLAEIAQAKVQVELESKLQKESIDKQFEIQKAEWDRIKGSANKSELYAFLQKYPSGFMSELAYSLLERSDKAQIKPQADQVGRIQEFAPRRYEENDVFEFIAKDGYTQNVVWKQTFTVLKVDDEGADVKGVRSNTPDWTFRVGHAGAQHGDNSGKFNPPITLMPAGLFQIGYKWNARTLFTSARTNKQEWLEITGKVVGRETIEVPAGKFDTFKVEVNMLYQSGNRMKLTVWTDPSIGAGIRNKIEFRSAASGNTDILIRDLISMKRGNRP